MNGLLKYRRWLILISQSFLIAATYLLAFQIAFDFEGRQALFVAFAQTLPLILLIKLVCFRRSGLLLGWWRYAGINELLDVTTIEARKLQWHPEAFACLPPTSGDSCRLRIA